MFDGPFRFVDLDCGAGFPAFMLALDAPPLGMVVPEELLDVLVAGAALELLAGVEVFDAEQPASKTAIPKRSMKRELLSMKMSPEFH